MPEPTGQGTRIVVNAVEGWGKTTLGAYMPDSAILMAGDETGYLTLVDHNRVPRRPCMSAHTWQQALDAPRQIGDGKTLVLDALGGFERMCHAFVCQRDFKGDWGEKGFTAYQRGYDVSLPEWSKFLAELDRLVARGITVAMLSHCQIAGFRNPMGADFDRYVSDVHRKTWALTHKWADAVLFGTFYTVIDEDKGRAKGIGGTQRVLYTERRDAFDAKNRFGMPEEIDIPDDPEQVYPTIWQHIRKES